MSSVLYRLTCQVGASDTAAMQRVDYRYPVRRNAAELRRSSPSCLGEHNAYVFGQIVGLPPDEIERLQNEGVIA